MDKKYIQLWKDVKYELEKEYSKDDYDELFSNINDVYKEQNNYLYLRVSDAFSKNRLEKFHLTKMNSFIKKFTDDLLKFKLITDEEIINEKEKSSSMQINTPETNLNNKYREGNIDSTYNFTNFVVGESNRFAYTISMQVASQPGMVANPLYIFGDVGLGKTHLMQAIGNYILDGDITSRVLYIKTENFVEEFVNSLKNKKSENAYIDKFKNIDILLVDDIQFLANKKQTQLEFFKVFDYLHNNNKQIVLTSDRPSADLTDIMNRLTSRFGWGLVVDIQSPNLDHRISILRKKLEFLISDSSIIENDVLEFIASSFVGNIRDLEGALKRVVFYCISLNYDINLENAKEALKVLLENNNINQTNKNSKETDKIQSVVANYYGVSVHDLLSKSRKQKIAFARQVAIYFVKNLLEIPYQKIGLLFGNRDHSTIMHAYSKVVDYISNDENVKKDIEILSKKLEKL